MAANNDFTWPSVAAARERVPSMRLAVRTGRKPPRGALYLIARMGRGVYDRLTLGDREKRLAVSFSADGKRIGVGTVAEGWKATRLKVAGAAELWIPAKLFEDLDPSFKAAGNAKFIEDGKGGVIAVLELQPGEPANEGGDDE